MRASVFRRLVGWVQIIDPRIRSGHTRLIPSPPPTQLLSRASSDWSISTNERPNVGSRRQTDSAGRGWTALFTSQPEMQKLEFRFDHHDSLTLTPHLMN